MSDNYEFTLITQEGCPHCLTIREILKDRISSGAVRVLDISNDKGAMDLANKHNITAVPSILVKDKATNTTEVCELSGDGRKVFCPDKEVEI